jgi:hypothetical protein
MTLAASGDGGWEVRGSWYRLHGAAGSQVAILDDLDGGRWAELRALAAVDRPDVRDEVLAVEGPRIEPAGDGGARLTWDLRTTAWEAERVVVEGGPHRIALHVEI